MGEVTQREIAYSGGAETVSVGQRFHDHSYGGDWEVVRFTGGNNYSPSGLGGTPTIECKCVGEVPKYWQKWVDEDGHADWCGDSVAASIALSRNLPPQDKTQG